MALYQWEEGDGDGRKTAGRRTAAGQTVEEGMVDRRMVADRRNLPAAFELVGLLYCYNNEQ